jgi:hypothetical protein
MTDDELQPVEQFRGILAFVPEDRNFGFDPGVGRLRHTSPGPRRGRKAARRARTQRRCLRG